MLRLIGPANETTIVVDDHEYPAGTQLTQMSLSLVQTLGLHTHVLNTIIETEPTWGGSVAYLGYVEARLKILGIDKMNKESLFMLINDSTYSK